MPESRRVTIQGGFGVFVFLVFEIRIQRFLRLDGDEVVTVTLTVLGWGLVPVPVSVPPMVVIFV